MGVQLRRLGPHSQVKALPLTDNDSTWIAGRGSNSDIFTLSRFASRQHFSIIYRRKNFFIVDHGSSNGTYVNDNRLHAQQEYPLPLNSIISVGVLSVHQNEPDCIVFAFEPCKEKQVAVKREPQVEGGKDEETVSRGVKEIEMQNVPVETNLDIKRRGPDVKSVQGNQSSLLPTFSKGSSLEETGRLTRQDASIEIKEKNLVKHRQENHLNIVKSEPICDFQSENEFQKNKIDMISVKKEKLNNSNVLTNSEFVVPDSEKDLFEPEGFADDEIVHAFEAQTQVDEPANGNSQLSYSMTEDFIEISDSEDEILSNIKMEFENVNFIKPELEDGDDYDDDVICLDIIKSNNKENYPPVTEIKLEDDDVYTETDMKWIGKLFKTKEECCSFIQSQRENADPGDSGENEDDWRELVLDCAKEIEEILITERAEEDKEGGIPMETNQECDRKPENYNLSSLSADEDNSTVIGLIILSPENQINVPAEKKEKSLRSTEKQSLTEDTAREPKRIKLHDPYEFEDETTLLIPNNKKRKLDISCPGSSKKPPLHGKHVKIAKTLYIPETTPKCKTARRRRKKIDSLPAAEKKRIKDQRRKKLREISLRDPPRDEKKDPACKVLAPLKVKITRKNRNEYLCHEITGLRDPRLNADKASNELGITKQVNFSPEKRDESIPSETVKSGTPVKKDSNGKVLEVINNDEKKENGVDKERVFTDKLALNQIENNTNVTVIARQEGGRALKSCLKKFGYAFMKTNRPIVPLKSVRFAKDPKIHPFETDNKMSRKTSSLKQANPRKKTSERRRLQYRHVVAEVCNWNASWLEEAKKAHASELPPPFQNLRHVTRTFPDHDNYMKTFIPLLLVELWQTISERWKACSSGMYRFPAVLESHTDNVANGVGSLELIKCESLAEVSAGIPLYAREGDLVIIQIIKTAGAAGQREVTSSGSKKYVCRIFGYLEKRTVVNVDPKNVNPHLIPKGRDSGPGKILKWDILVKKRPEFFKNASSLFQITGVFHVAPQLMQCQAVCTLPMSPLCQRILSPNRSDSTLLPSQTNESITFKGSLDDTQRELILKMVSSCINRNHNLLQIQGGAGTGKTLVMLAFILQLLYTKLWRTGSRPKILYCAHSNIVVDDMALKLKNYRQTLSRESKYNLVRYGHVNSMKPSVRDISTHSLGLKNDHNVNLTNRTKALDEKIKGLVADLEASQMLNQKAIDEKSSKLHACVKEREKLKASKPGSLAGQTPTYESESDIIEHADVICTTCISSGTKIMQSVFERIKSKNPRQKIICIVDEAMQCKETEVVVPLQLGVTDIILVGDSRQLRSPVRNELVKSLGLNQSLFWRISCIFRQLRDLSPIVNLRTQYRMKSAISAFPNKLFYDTYLRDGFRSEKKYKIDDYVVLIDSGVTESSIETDGENRLNAIAVKLIKEVLNTVGDDIPDNNFGIITCRFEQAKNLKALLNETLNEKLLSKIDVNPIENVQGEEFDIVLFIFDPNMECAGRVNVAVTRAKHSLITLMSNPVYVNNKILKKLGDEAIVRGVSSLVNTTMEGQLLLKMITKNQGI